MLGPQASPPARVQRNPEALVLAESVPFDAGRRGRLRSWHDDAHFGFTVVATRLLLRSSAGLDGRRIRTMRRFIQILLLTIVLPVKVIFSGVGDFFDLTDR